MTIRSELTSFRPLPGERLAAALAEINAEVAPRNLDELVVARPRLNAW